MARTVAQIQSQIMAQIASSAVLSGKLTSPSQVAIYRCYAFIMATAISITENLRDIFITEVESTVASAPPGTPQWIIKMLLYFQYSPTTLQVVAVDLSNNPIVAYPVVDASLNVIANAAVITNPNKQVLIKVAPLASNSVFDTPTINALTTYLDLINFAGVEFSIINALPDLFLIGANIWYDGQYSNTIQAAVNAAINNYLATLPFNGLITLNGGQGDPGLIAAIMAVPGVQDIEFTNISIRQNTTAAADATFLVEGAETIYRNYGTYSGRAIIDSANQGTVVGGVSYVLNFNVNS